MVFDLKRTFPTLVQPKPAPPPEPKPPVTPAATPVAQPGTGAAPSGFVQDNPQAVATALGSDPGEPVTTAVPKLTGTQIQALQAGGPEALLGLTEEQRAKLLSSVRKPEDVPPSEAPQNQEVTADMDEAERAAYDGLSESDRAKYNQQYRAAKAEGPEAVERMEHLLVEGLASDYVNASKEDRQTYDTLYAASKAEGTPEGATAEVDGLLADGELGAYSDVSEAAGSSERGHLQALLFNGTLRANDTETPPKSMLDYTAEFVNAEPEGTTTTGVDRGAMVNQLINDVYLNKVTQPEGDRNCGPLQVLGEFAKGNPAGYARVLTELAQKGEVTVQDADGNPVKLEFKGPPGQIGKLGEETLTLTEEIFVESFGRYIDQKYGGNGDGFLGRLVGRFMDSIDGMTAREVADLRELTTGVEQEAMTVPDADEIGTEEGQATQEEADKLREEAEQTIDEQLKAGEHPMVLLDGHWVRVTGHVQVGVPPVEINIYFYDDASGKPQMSSGSAFMEKVESVVYNPEHSDVPNGSYNESWDDPGTGSSSLPGGGDPDGGLRRG